MLPDLLPDPVPDRLLPIQPDGDATPLYCVPPASGSPYSYLPLAGVVGSRQPVYGLEAPGFDDDEPSLHRLEDLSRVYNAAVEEHRGSGSACLLGWSLGGVIAYDMACRRTAAGLPVPVLILVDTPVPGPEPVPVPEERLVLHRFVAELAADPEPAGLDRVIGGWAPHRPIRPVFAALAQAGLIPGDLDEETLVRRYGVFRGGIQAMAGYRAEGGYPGPVLSVRAQLSAPLPGDWHTLARHVEEHSVPGDHYSIWKGEGLLALGDLISRALRDLSAGVSERVGR